MTLTEKVAYLKGLADGLGIDAEDSKEAKLISAIIDVLEEIALDIADLEENDLAIGDELDQLSDDLADVEELIYEEDDEYDDEYEEDDEYDYCDGCCGEEPVFYEVTCPACENTITIDEDVLDLGSIDCPNCGEALVFDLEEEEEEE